MIIYLVGPISGKGYGEVVSELDKKRTRLQSMGYKVFSPMTGKEYLRNEVEFMSHGYNNPASSNSAIFGRDKWMVAQAVRDNAGSWLHSICKPGRT